MLLKAGAWEKIDVIFDGEVGGLFPRIIGRLIKSKET
jgi:hypothetical protein